MSIFIFLYFFCIFFVFLKHVFFCIPGSAPYSPCIFFVFLGKVKASFDLWEFNMDSNTALQELCHKEKAFGDFTAKRHWRKGL